MSIDIKAPTFPESVADGTVATWHKQPGEACAADDLIVDIETDKVVLEVVAPADGVIKEIVKNEGDTVLSEEVIAVFEEGAAGAAPAAAAPAAESAAATEAAGETGDGDKVGPAARQADRRKQPGCQPDPGDRQGRRHHQGRCPQLPEEQTGGCSEERRTCGSAGSDQCARG